MDTDENGTETPQSAKWCGWNGDTMTEADAAAFRAWIMDELRRRGWSQRQLAHRSGMAPASLNDLLNNRERVPRASTIRKLEAVLGAYEPAPGVAANAALLAFIQPEDVKDYRPDNALQSIADLAAGDPKRWRLAIYTPETTIQIIPAGRRALCLLDMARRPASGDLLMVRSPIGDGLRYFVDPYLITPGTGAQGYEVMGAAGVDVVGRLDMAALLFSEDDL